MTEPIFGSTDYRSRKIAKDRGFLIQDVREILKADAELQQQILAEGGVVKVEDLYKISPTTLKARKRYDFRIEKTIEMPEKRTVKLIQLSKLKKLLSE